MSDLERQLEEMFMSDSRSRRVGRVNVSVRRRNPFGTLAFVGGIAVAALALIVAFSLIRGGREIVPAASASPSSSAAAVGSASPTASAVPGEQVMCGQVSRFSAPTATVSGSFVITPSGESGSLVVVLAGTPMSGLSGYACVRIKNLPQGAPSVFFVSLLTRGMDGYVAEGASRSAAPSTNSAGVRPDAQHGVIARGTGEGEGVMRAESDAAVLKSFPRQLSAAVTRDGLRVAYFRTTQTGAQLVTFDTAKPNAEKLLIDFSGSGEVPGEVVWSSDASNELLISVHQIGQVPAPGISVTYSSLRAIDAGTGAVREIARITNGLYMRPLAWHGSSNTAAVLEWFPSGGFAANYDYIRAGTVTRSPFEQQVVASSVRADADGQRVLSISGLPAPRGVKWWPIDRFDTRRELKTEGNDISVAHWRAGTDEIVVFPSPMSKDVPGANPRIEAWDVVSGQKRTVAENVGPLGILRADGSAAITTSWMLVDLRTGAVTAIPNSTINEIPYLAVRF